MVNDELSGFGIVLKCQLFGYVTQFQVWFVTTSNVSNDSDTYCYPRDGKLTLCTYSLVQPTAHA